MFRQENLHGIGKPIYVPASELAYCHMNDMDLR